MNPSLTPKVISLRFNIIRRLGGPYKRNYTWGIGGFRCKRVILDSSNERDAGNLGNNHGHPDHHCIASYETSPLLFRFSFRAKPFARSNKPTWHARWRASTVAARARDGLAAYAVDICRSEEKRDNSVVVSTETSMTILLLMET